MDLVGKGIGGVDEQVFEQGGLVGGDVREPAAHDFYSCSLCNSLLELGRLWRRVSVTCRCLRGRGFDRWLL